MAARNISLLVDVLIEDLVVEYSILYSDSNFKVCWRMIECIFCGTVILVLDANANLLTELLVKWHSLVKKCNGSFSVDVVT